MKILYDHQVFSMQAYGGISRYFCELMDQYNRSKEIEIVLSCKSSCNCYLPRNAARYSPLPAGKITTKMRQLFGPFDNTNKNHTLQLLSVNDFDVFHPTYYDTYFINKLKGKPFVLTVHDMIHEIFFEQYRDYRIIDQKRTLIENSKEIIAVSDNTKKDILAICDLVDESKIHVIHHGAPRRIVAPEKPDNAGNEDYLLFVGHRERYKNFYNFLLSIQRILKNHDGLKAICVGGNSFSDIENRFIDRLGLSGRVIQYSADDEKLASCYSNATALVFPSLYEGFGMPVLEAFSYDCPVVCSNTGPLPEVASDAAVYFDPRNIKSMHDSIEKIVSDSDLRQEMKDLGKRRLADFSWEKTAKLTKKVYDRTVS